MEKIKSNLSRLRLIGAMFAAALGFGLVGLSFGAGGASAAPPTLPADPTGGAMADVQTEVQDWVLTYGAPVLFGLIILGILIRIGTKWTRRAGKAV